MACVQGDGSMTPRRPRPKIRAVDTAGRAPLPPVAPQNRRAEMVEGPRPAALLRRLRATLAATLAVTLVLRLAHVVNDCCSRGGPPLHCQQSPSQLLSPCSVLAWCLCDGCGAAFSGRGGVQVSSAEWGGGGRVQVRSAVKGGGRVQVSSAVRCAGVSSEGTAWQERSLAIENLR